MVRIELDRNLNAIASPSDVSQVAFELIERAEAEGWVRELFRAAQASNPGSLALAELGRELQLGPTPAETLLPALRTALQGLGLSPRRVQEAYVRALPALAPDHFTPLPTGPTIASPAIEYASNLAKLAAPRSDGLPPLLLFVRLLGMEAAAPSQAALRQWLDEAVQKLVSQPLSQEATLNQALTPNPECLRRLRYLRVRWGEEAGAAASLLVSLEPAVGTTGNYQLRAWLLAEGEAEPLGEGEGEYTRAEVISELAYLVDEVASRDFPMESLRIEFLLPHRLLVSEEVDQWRRSLMGVETALGRDFEVVVRPLERHYGAPFQALSNRWRRHPMADRAALLCDTLEAPQTHDCSRIWAASGSGNAALLNTLEGCHWLVGAWLMRPPTEAEPAELLAWLLRAGVPLALWVRKAQCEDYGVLRTQMAALLETRPLAELPARVKEARREAAGSGDEQHLGHFLTLIWDDPDRRVRGIGPRFRSRAPQRR